MSFLEAPDTSGKYTGIYRARVEARVDPKKLYRVRVRVHGIHSEETPVNKLPWAKPKKEVGKRYGVMGVPVLKTDVWVEFEEGDHEYPVYFGAAFGTDTIIDGEDENKHRVYPTKAYGKKRSEGVLQSESDAEQDKSPDNFGMVSPLQKRVELDDRFERERLLIADAHDNFLWLNTERGVITLEAAIGEQTKGGPARARGITFNSDPDIQSVQLYTFRNWQITVDDIEGVMELASPQGSLIRITDNNTKNSIEAWTAGGKRLILDDSLDKLVLASVDGYGVSVNNGEQRVMLFTKDGDHSVLLDRKRKLLRIFSVDDINIDSKKNIVLNSEQDIELNPKRLLHFDKKNGDVSVTDDKEKVGVELSGASTKPTKKAKVKRAPDYDFYS